MFLGASAIIIITLNQRVLRKVGYGNTHDNLSSTKLLSLLQKLGYNLSLQPFLGLFGWTLAIAMIGQWCSRQPLTNHE